MPSELNTYINQLIADYLSKNNYLDTLDSLKLETNSTFINKPLESLETIVSDRLTYLSIHDNKSSSTSATNSNTLPKWTVSKSLNNSTLSPYKLESSSISNSLLINSYHWQYHKDDITKKLALFVSNNSSKSILLYDLLSNSNNSIGSIDNLHGSNQLKSLIPINKTNILLSLDMNSTLQISEVSINSIDHIENTKRMSYKLHNKLIIDLIYTPIDLTKTNGYLSLITYDKKLIVYKLSISDNQIELLDSVNLFNIPTCIYATYINSKLVIMSNISESTLVSVYQLSSNDNKLKETTKISLNDSQFSLNLFHITNISQLSNNHFTFSTNHVPYMRLITIKLDLNELITPESELQLDSNSESITTTPIKRNVIISNINSLSPQDKFSQTKVISRYEMNKSTTGLIILSDDGKIRFIDLSLEEGNELINEIQLHQGRIKTGFLATEDQLVTCGIDRDVYIIN